jgi:ATP-binding cassette subfamily F protein 3
MISIKNVTVEFSGKILFEDVNFSINYGEKIGLVGRNGSGKSTFFKLLNGALIPDTGSVEISDYYTIGHLDQHIKFRSKTVIEEVCSVLTEDRLHDEWKGEKILFGLGFTKAQMSQDPMLFSGGWQVKINLAKMLLTEPNLLLLDEPTNYLDIYSIRWLGSFLKKWQGELVLITHDRSFMDSVITNSLIIHRHKFRKVKGTPSKIKEQIAIEEEIYEKTRLAEEKKNKETEDWIRRFGAKASKASAVQSRVKMLEKQEVKEKLAHINELDFKFKYHPHNANDLIKVKNLHFGYSPDNLLIKGLDITVAKDDKICIIGKNGNGKSTLLQLMIKLLNPLNGNVEMHDKVKHGYFSQMNNDRLNPNMTICEELATVNPSLDIGTVRRICSLMLFSGDLAHKKISVLSGGEKSRVMLGKILLSQVNVLLLDEPTNHFDMESSESLMDAIKQFEGAVVMVTHNEYFLRQIATKLIVFDNQKVFCFDGGYDKFLSTIGWKEEV